MVLFDVVDTVEMVEASDVAGDVVVFVVPFFEITNSIGKVSFGDESTDFFETFKSIVLALLDDAEDEPKTISDDGFCDFKLCILE